MPAPSGPIQVSALSRIQSPTGARAMLTVRSALRNVHVWKSSVEEVPLQKSAATTARITWEIGAPSTIDRLTRYQIAAGPIFKKPPRTMLTDNPVTNGVRENGGSIGVPRSGEGTSIAASAISGGSGRLSARTLSTVARTTATLFASSLTAQS